MEKVREIPEGWVKKEIRELFKVASGDLLSSKDMRFGKYPVYGGNGICGYHNAYNFNTSKMVIGRVGVYCGCIYKTEDKSWITDNALYIKNKLCDYEEEFMFYKLKHMDLNKYADKNAQPLISGSKIYGIKIDIPKSKKEQQKIAKVLSTLDQNIQKTEQTIKKYKNIKNGLMDDLLTGKIRIKDGKWVKETEFKEVEGIGKVPKEWEVKELKEIIKICYGKDQKSVQDNVNGRYPILGTGGQIGKSVQYLYDKPSVLIGRKGTIDKPRYIEEPFWTVDTLFYTEIYESYVPKWVYYALKLINFNIYNEATGVPSLNPKTIYKIKLSIPSKNEQKHIVKTITKQDQLIEKEQHYLKKLKKLKSGLMEDLLTGKVRVKL